MATAGFSESKLRGREISVSSDTLFQMQWPHGRRTGFRFPSWHQRGCGFSAALCAMWRGHRSGDSTEPPIAA